MSKLLNVSSSPHIRGQVSTTTIMADVIIALFPASAWGVYKFGWNAFFLILACVLTSVLTEYLYEKLMRKPSTVHDLSAFVTGLLLALNLSPRVPIWIAILGSIFAVLVVKMLYGGIGQNFMNPALAARCFLLISFGKQMTEWGTSTDAITGATPLGLLKGAENMTNAADVLAANKVTLLDMFTGNIYGCIGEISVLMILIGAAYLLIRRVISWRIPVLYIGTFAVFMYIVGIAKGYGADPSFVTAQLCGGGLMLGAFFMATDYTTSPITNKGRIYYGIILGLVTAIFRTWSQSAEGVSYAIIFCNLLVPLIEKISLPTAFGRKGAVKNVSK